LADEPATGSAVKAVIDENLWHHCISAKAFSAVLRVYDAFIQEDRLHHSSSGQMLQEALDIVRPEAQERETRKQRNQYEQCVEQLREATQELDALIPSGNDLILVDQGDWGYEIFADRRAIPFMERNGHYWGPPPDDATAIREFERLQRFEPSFMVFGWPAFWWLDYYSEFNSYLRSRFRCILQNDNLVVFDLRPWVASGMASD
jgi:hypothetical protein